MTGITENQGTEIINLLRTLTQGGNLGAGKQWSDLEKALNRSVKSHAEQNAHQKRVEAAQKTMTSTWQQLSKSYAQRFEQFNKNHDVKMQLVADTFEQSVKDLRFEELEKIPGIFKSQFQNSTNPIIQQMISQVKTLEGVEQFREDIEHLHKITTLAQTDEAKAKEESVKFLKKYSSITAEAAENMGLLKEAVAENVSAQQNVAYAAQGGALGEITTKGKEVAGIFAKVAGAASLLYVQFMDVVQGPLRMGTEVLDSFDAFRAGMNPEEFAQLQAQYRQSIGASNMTLDQFQDKVIEGAGVLTAYTGDLRDAVRVQASSFETARKYGVQGEQETRAFMDRQNAIFKEFNTVFSMTAEEFMSMNEQMRESQAVQSNIYRLNRQQRRLYIEQYQQTIKQLKVNGLSQEAAMAAADAMAALGAQSPKERLKQAAKLQAVGGALGMGAESARAAELIRQRKTTTPEFAELMTEMQKRTGEVMGQGLGQEMMVSQMLDTTGLGNILGPNSDFAKLNTEQYKKLESLDAAAVQRNEKLGGMLLIFQRIEKLFTGPWGKLLGTIAAGVGTLAAGGMLGKLGLAGGLAGLLGPLIPAILAVLAGGGLIAGIIAAASGDKDDRTRGERRRDAAKATSKRGATPTEQIMTPAEVWRKDIAHSDAKVLGHERSLKTFKAEIEKLDRDDPTQQKTIELYETQIKKLEEMIENEREGTKKVQVLLEKHLQKADEGNQTAKEQLDETKKSKKKEPRLTWTHVPAAG
jgi:hypothetical protein